MEDDEAVRSTLSKFLHREGWDVMEAADGVAGRELFMAHPTDIVLVDLMLPRLDGMDLVSDLRSIDRDVPIVIHTGYATRKRYHEALRAGVTEFIAKPCDSDKLAKTLENVLVQRKENNNKKSKLAEEIQ